MADASSSPAAEVSGQLVRLARLTSSFKAQAAARSPHGVEWSAYAVLSHLVSDGPQRLKCLAERMHADPSTISRQASALVDIGLVERGPDPDDGRAVQLAASPSGHALFQSMRAHRAQMFDAVLTDWSAKDTVSFAALLARFNTDFEKYLREVLRMVAPDATTDARPPTLQESS